ncbi:MAG: Uncharacterised protein [Flavobacteriia bacterium]|nr:MAG: Uncharacterised protein [Flavobacteriia bacterium]
MGDKPGRQEPSFRKGCLGRYRPRLQSSMAEEKAEMGIPDGISVRSEGIQDRRTDPECGVCAGLEPLRPGARSASGSDVIGLYNRFYKMEGRSLRTSTGKLVFRFQAIHSVREEKHALGNEWKRQLARFKRQQRQLFFCPGAAVPEKEMGTLFDGGDQPGRMEYGKRCPGATKRWLFLL